MRHGLRKSVGLLFAGTCVVFCWAALNGARFSWTVKVDDIPPNVLVEENKQGI